MNLADSVGWTLVHSVWEIAAISLMLFVSGLAFRGTTSNVRYTAALIALFACLIAPVVTYVVLVPSGAKGDPITPLSVVAQASQTPAVASVQNSPSLMGQTPTVERLGKQIDPVLPSVVFLWLVGLAFMSLRLLGGLIVVERIKRAASSHVDTGTRERTATLARRLGIRRTICLRVSANVSTPAVVGFLRTVILLPASAVAKLSPSDLEALLAHELAHVRRYDYVVNFAQSLVETALFYHPGVWWISSVVRTEREHCCDDIALSVLEDREQYARALLSLEQLRSSSPRLAMAANGGALLARIRRIVLPQAGRAIPGSTWAVLAIAIGITVGLAGTLHAKQGPARKVGAKHKVEIPFDGRVVDERGRPLAGVTVLAEGFDFATRKQGPLVEVVSDSKGEFHLERASNIVGLKSGALMGLAYWKAPMKVTLTMMPVKAIRIRAVDTLGRPVAGAVIGPEALGTESNYQRIREGSQIFNRFACTTDSSGYATLENIPTKASVFLAVEDEHLAIQRNTARIQAHRNDDVVTVVLELASTVSGTVTSGGKPAPHSYVFAYSTNEVAPSFTP
ncbi:MAG: M56 family metallopeptidase, partial [Fimbriimonas sp.]|nr:M56 family metallopeptidase [Fimbriimonas sp.]